MAAEHGFGHVSLQWDDPRNHGLAGALREALEDRGLSFGVWESKPVPGTRAVEETGASHYIAQAEAPEPWSEIAASAPDVPRAVVTTFHGLGALSDGAYDPAVAAPVVDGGFHCLTEAYYGVSPNWTPDRLDFTGTQQLGWPQTQPVIGVFGGQDAETYVRALNLGAYPGYFVWLAETMTAEDWRVLGEFNAR